MSSVNKDRYISSFPIITSYFLFLSYCKGKTFSPMLKSSEETALLGSRLLEWSGFSAMKSVVIVGFLIDCLYQLEGVPLLSNLHKVLS